MAEAGQRQSQADTPRLLLVAGLFVSGFLILVCHSFSLKWETNDDVAMSMVAHGYGLAAKSSPNLIFSNVLWGYIVRSIPSVNGILGYSVGALAALFAAGTGIFYFSRKLGLGWLAGGLIVALALLRPTIFPQFTLNSGLLSAAAVLGIASYAASKERKALIAVLALVLLAYVIRSQEFIIVLLTALPFLGIKQLYKDKAFRLFLLAATLVILTAIFLDWMAYRGPDWDNFFAINRARAGYTDFGLADRLKARPEIISLHGYTSNDIDLLKSFFFSDPSILNPDRLNAMAGELGALPFITGNLTLAADSVRTLFSPNIRPLMLLTVALFAFRPSRNGAYAFLLVLSIAFVLGLIGRGGLERVLVPLATVLAIFSAITFFQKAGPRGKQWGLVPILLAAIANLWIIYPQAQMAEAEIRTAQAEAGKYPGNVLFAWGGDIRLEAIFPLLARDRNAREMKMYGMGVFTHAPFSRAHLEETEGRGLVPRIRSSDGILMIASQLNIGALRTWCHERYHAALLDEVVFAGSITVIKQIKCE